MLTLRYLALWVHLLAVVVALGGGLFANLVLAPVLVRELQPQDRLRVAARLIPRMKVVAFLSLGLLILTGVVNLLYMGPSILSGRLLVLLLVKLLLVFGVIILNLLIYLEFGATIIRAAAEPAARTDAVPKAQARMRKAFLANVVLVGLIIYISLAFSRTP